MKAAKILLLLALAGAVIFIMFTQLNIPASVKAIADAIARQEGYGAAAGNRPTRNNNPGDLRNWPGVPADSGGFAIFPTAAAGWAALFEDVQNHIAANPSQTILGWISEYAPASDGNDPYAYAQAVAASVNASIYTSLGSLA